ncbi:MAG: VCBS repeat-containing protein [Cellvibrionaceae bacterium]
MDKGLMHNELRNSLSTKKLPAAALVCGATFACSTALAAPAYVSSVIEPEAEIRGQHHAELNGDGLQDLLLSVWSEQRGRELLVYLQGSNGQFPGKPSQRIEIKSDIVAYGLADLRDEAGEELIFLTRSAAYSYSTRKDSYTGNLEKLVDWAMLATVPEKQSIDFAGRFEDYNGDGFIDILLPGPEHYAVFYGDEQGDFGSATALPKPYHDLQLSARSNTGFNFTNEAGLRFVIETPSAFEGLFPEPDEHREEEGSAYSRFTDTGRILDVEQWLASVTAARINADNLPDFIFLDHAEGKTGGKEDARRFNVLYQNAKGKVGPEIDWQSTLAASGQILVADYNADGLDDVLVVEPNGSDQTNLRFFTNRGGEFNFQQANQVLRFSGYEVEAQFQDLTGDGVPELIVSHYSLAAVDALRSGSMLRTTLIYASNPEASEGGGAVFSQRPSTKVEDKFSASSVKGLAERMHFSADVTGDGRKEALALDGDGALVAKSIADNLQIGTEPAWRFVPLQLIQTVLPANLNNDSSTDFLLRHQKALTVLVSQP